MTTITIGAGAAPGQLAKAFRDLFEKDRQAAVRALRNAAVEVRNVAIEEVLATKPYPPTNTSGSGGLLGHWVNKNTPDGAVVENTAPQAIFMEYGTKPHWAPLRPLVVWAQMKARGGAIKNVYALAKGTQKAIAARGTAPRHFWQRTLAKAPEIVERRVREALEAVRS